MAELTELIGSKRPDLVRQDELLTAIKAATRLKTDPAGFGRMSDETIAFWVFVRAVVRPLVTGWCDPGPIHDDIVSGLMSECRNILVLASRGSAKSTFTAFYALWRLWRDPENETILVVSQGESHARDMLRMVRDLIERSPVLGELTPADDSPDNMSQFVVGPATGQLGMSVSFRSIGITGQITGKRARLIILDDVETPKHDSAEAIDKLSDQISEAHNVIVPGPQSRIIVLGTPQSQMSLYGRLVESGEWDVHRACLFQSDVLNGQEVFHSRWPDRFSADDIAGRKRNMSARLFALHWRIDLSQAATDERPIRISSLSVVDLDPLLPTAPIVLRGGGGVISGLSKGNAAKDDNWRGVSEVSSDSSPYTLTVAAVDPAGGLVGKGDAIGLAIASSTGGGAVIVRQAVGVRTETVQSSIQECARLIALHRANCVYVEQERDGLFASQLSRELAARGYPLNVEPVTTGKQKKGARIIGTLVPAFASKRVFVCKAVLTSPDSGIEFVNQLTGINYDGRRLKHDDIVDALSYAVAAFKDILCADPAAYIASARFSAERLRKLPIRMCAVPDDMLDAWAAQDENAEELRERLNAVIETHADEVAMGLPSSDLALLIEQLKAQLAQYEQGGHHVRHGMTFDSFQDRIAEKLGG